MPKRSGQHTVPSSSLGGYLAGVRPTSQVRMLYRPEGCLCAWDMHGERNEEGFYTGLYWFILKYRHTDCRAKRNGEHG